MFVVDGESGQIEVAAGVQLAVGSTYRFTVEVDDGNGGTARGVVEVMVRPEVAEVVSTFAAYQDEVPAMVMDRDLAIAAAAILQGRLNAPPAAFPPAGRVVRTGKESEDEPLYMRMASATDQWSSWRREHDSGDDRVRRMQWQDFMYSRGFDFALDDAGSRGPRTRLWGSGSRSNLSGSPLESQTQILYSGSSNLMMVGMETGQARTRLGLAVGQANAEMSLGRQSGGKVDRSMNVVYPYLSFQLGERMKVWAVGGYGRGDYIREDGSGADRVRTVRDASYASAAGGIERGWGKGPTEFSAGIKAVLVNSWLEGLQVPDARPEVSGNSWRSEANLQAAHMFTLQHDLSLRPFVGLHLHHDSGRGWLKTNSMDTTAGMLLDWGMGLKFEFNSRWQIKDGDVNEERFKASIDYDFGRDRRGLMLSASPSADSVADGPFSRSLSARVGLRTAGAAAFRQRHCHLQRCAVRQRDEPERKPTASASPAAGWMSTCRLPRIHTGST